MTHRNTCMDFPPAFLMRSPVVAFLPLAEQSVLQFTSSLASAQAQPLCLCISSLPPSDPRSACARAVTCYRLLNTLWWGESHTLTLAAALREWQGESTHAGEWQCAFCRESLHPRANSPQTLASLSIHCAMHWCFYILAFVGKGISYWRIGLDVPVSKAGAGKSRLICVWLLLGLKLQWSCVKNLQEWVQALTPTRTFYSGGAELLWIQR